MIAHKDLGVLHFTRSRKLLELIRNETITFAGNKRLKIYGTLQCVSGKKMKAENRIFFHDKSEAIVLGYRPCGHCMKAEYLLWKNKRHEHFDLS
jgi:methylphosphotriester-DNA--protein-cysteine methyltransferase